MRSSVFLKIALSIVLLLVAASLFASFHFARFQFVPVGNKMSYMVDNYSGEVWFIIGSRKWRLLDVYPEEASKRKEHKGPFKSQEEFDEWLSSFDDDERKTKRP